MKVAGSRSHSIDLLRGLSVIVVILSHYFALPNSPFPVGASFFIPGAWIAVDVFFVLSGFLLGGQLLDGKMTTGGFYIRLRGPAISKHCRRLLHGALLSPESGPANGCILAQYPPGRTAGGSPPWYDLQPLVGRSSGYRAGGQRDNGWRPGPAGQTD
jgi:Acyltransferase family